MAQGTTLKTWGFGVTQNSTQVRCRYDAAAP